MNKTTEGYMKDYSEHETTASLAEVIKITCGYCKRDYWVTNELAKAIAKGKVENECFNCDGSHQPEGDDL